MAKLLWGYIGGDRKGARVWHVYTRKAAKLGNGICMARPVCGATAHGFTEQRQITDLDRPLHCQTPDTICPPCDRQFDKWIRYGSIDKKHRKGN